MAAAGDDDQLVISAVFGPDEVEKVEAALAAIDALGHGGAALVEVGVGEDVEVAEYISHIAEGELLFNGFGADFGGVAGEGLHAVAVGVVTGAVGAIGVGAEGAGALAVGGATHVDGGAFVVEVEIRRGVADDVADGDLDLGLDLVHGSIALHELATAGVAGDDDGLEVREAVLVVEGEQDSVHGGEGVGGFGVGRATGGGEAGVPALAGPEEFAGFNGVVAATAFAAFEDGGDDDGVEEFAGGSGGGEGGGEVAVAVTLGAVDHDEGSVDAGVGGGVGGVEGVVAIDGDVAAAGAGHLEFFGAGLVVLEAGVRGGGLGGGSGESEEEEEQGGEAGELGHAADYMTESLVCTTGGGFGPVVRF